MALGGGNFIAQNKVLPGAYINFISVASASSLIGERGVVGMGLDLDWGEEGKIMEITIDDFQSNSMKILGYSASHEKLKGLRDLFRNVTTLYAYRVNKGGVKASNTYATAKCSGIRGNDIKIVIQKNIDEITKFDVQTYLGTVLVDVQTVATSAELVANDYVTFKTAALAVTSGTALTSGTNGTSNSSSHQEFLDKIESYPSINAIGYVGTDDAIKGLYAAFVKRMREEIGVKFQAVVFDKAADYEGVVNVKNSVDLVWWATGVIAGTAINASATNNVYDGEFDIQTDYTQKQLESAIRLGEWTLHQVGSEIRVLEDINSLVSVTENKGEIFKDNQTIRVVDQVATDIASLFANKYLGNVPNDAAGRTSLWADIVKHHAQLQDIRAIENFSDEDVSIEPGNDKKSVVVNDAIAVVNSMTKLYMTVQVL